MICFYSRHSIKTLSERIKVCSAYDIGLTMEQVVSALLWSDATHSNGEFTLISIFAENKNGLNES